MQKSSYSSISRVEPGDGAKLPAYLVSRYDDGGCLLFSHGKIDIWCVYHGKETNPDGAEPTGEVYPLEQKDIVVDKMQKGGTRPKLGFLGNFADQGSTMLTFEAPEDVDYLQSLRDLANKYGKVRAWNTFWELYECIPQKRDVLVSEAMTNIVASLASQYPDEPDLRFTLDCLLCAMIAENNRLKKYGSPYDTRLGKKLKALAAYQAIYEDLSIREIADFSKNKGWQWISRECSKRGINTPNM